MPAHVAAHLDSIPVPEDVAAAVRRAITAIEAATLAPAGPPSVTFGPMHVTSMPGQAGPYNPFAAAAPSGMSALDTLTDPHGIPAIQYGQPMPEAGATVAPMISFDNASGGLATLTPLQPAQLAANPLAAPISTERKGALRRLIDGIRRK
jgi:hypothetical protein